MSELRDKIYKYLDYYYYEVLGNGKGNDANIVTDYIMQLIQAERTKAKEEIVMKVAEIIGMNKSVPGYAEHTITRLVLFLNDELKQSLAEKGTDE